MTEISVWSPVTDLQHYFWAIIAISPIPQRSQIISWAGPSNTKFGYVVKPKNAYLVNDILTSNILQAG